MNKFSSANKISEGTRNSFESPRGYNIKISGGKKYRTYEKQTTPVRIAKPSEGPVIRRGRVKRRVAKAKQTGKVKPKTGNKTKAMTVNQYFDHVYCLNLDHRTDRWRRVSRIFTRNNITVERFSAIDGAALTRETTSQYSMTLGEVGCFLSHLAIIQDAKRHSYSKILVFEDDVLLANHFVAMFDKVIQHIPDTWRLLYLGASQYNWKIDKQRTGYFLSRDSYGSFAYGLSASIYDEILNLKSSNSLPYDSVLLQLQTKFYGNCFTLHPFLVIADTTNSDLRDGRPLRKHARQMRWNLNLFSESLKLYENTNMRREGSPQLEQKTITLHHNFQKHNDMKYSLNQIFGKIWVINMPKDKLKKNNILHQFRSHQIQFEFMTAIDGSEIEIKSIPSKYNKLKRGEIGYLLTYKKIFETAISKNYQNILVFDDDVILCHDFNARFRDSYAVLPRGWQILRLGSSQHIFQDACKSPYYQTPFHTDGSFAVGYQREVFDYLIRQIDETQTTYDSGPLRAANRQFGNDYTVFPFLVIADVSKSGIRGGRNITTMSARLKWNLFDFPFVYYQLKVSIIMPLYNKKSTVEDAIRSILNQTYRNIELIVVDDCSTDGSADLVSNMIQQQGLTNVTLIRNNTNQGCYAVRNLGIMHSTGDYIAFQDPDDYSFNDRIEQQMRDIITRNVPISFCKIYRFRSVKPIYNSDNTVLLEQVKRDACEIYQRPSLGMVTSIIKRDLFDRYGLYNVSYRHSQDLGIIEKFYCLEKGVDPDDIEHMWTFINDNSDGSFIFLNPNLMYISDLMNQTNITNKYSQYDRDQAMQSWKSEIKILQSH